MKKVIIPMLVVKLTTDEIFNLTAGVIGHLTDVKQLQFIVKFTNARLKLLKKKSG